MRSLYIPALPVYAMLLAGLTLVAFMARRRINQEAYKRLLLPEKKIPPAISNQTPPLLIFGYGNPSRGDDALGPLLLERLEALDLPDIELLTDFQLQVEHALDLQNRERVLFVDANVSCTPPYIFSQLQAEKDASFTSHVMSPMALLHAYRNLYGPHPPAYLLEIRGERFELGEPLSPEAAANLDASLDLVKRLCQNCTLHAWEYFLSHERPLP